MAGEVADLNDWEGVSTATQWAPQNGVAGAAGTVETTGTPYTIVTDVVRSGSQAGRITLSSNEGESYNAGWRRCLLRETYDNSNNEVLRAERYGDHYWYTASYLVNTGTYFPSGTLVWEVHQGDDLRSFGSGSETIAFSVSAVAPLALQWRNNEWQFRVHAGQASGGSFKVYGGNIDNYSLGLTSKNEGLWRDWIIEVLYDDPGAITVYSRLEGEAEFSQVLSLPSRATVMYASDKTALHKYYRLEGVYQPLPSPTSTQTRMWLDNNGRHLTLDDARSVYGLVPPVPDPSPNPDPPTTTYSFADAAINGYRQTSTKITGSQKTQGALVRDVSVIE